MTSTWQPISKTAIQYFDINGDPYSGAVLKAYDLGTTTPINFATDDTGATQVGTITLNAIGYPEVSGNIIIPHINKDYKIALYPNQASADANSGAVWVVDRLFSNFDNSKVTIKNATEARQLNEILQPIRSVKDFGVLGDGTDDRNNINSAIAQIESESGGIVFFPDPDVDYAISGSLNITSSNVTLSFSPNARLIPIDSSGFILISALGSDASSFFALNSDALEDEYTITTTNPITGASIGDYISIRSTKLLTGTNNKLTRQNIYRKITNISGASNNVYTLDKPLKYDYNISDAAEAGKANFIENLKFINLRLNKKDFNHKMSLGASLKYCADVVFETPQVYGTKDKYGADIDGRSALKFEACQNVEVRNVSIEHIGWYGVEFTGSCDYCRVINGIIKDVRHAQDINHASTLNTFAGECNDVVFFSITAYNTTRAAFSTHDVGRDIVFSLCKAYNAGYLAQAAGFYIRNVACVVESCKSYYASGDGLYADSSAFAVYVTGFYGIKNDRDGLRISNYGQVIGLNASENGDAGFSIGGGTILNARTLNNAQFAGRVSYYADATTRAANEQVTITNWTAPRSATQTACLRLETASGVNPERNVTLAGENRLTGFGTALFVVSSGDNSQVPLTNQSIITDYGDGTNEISGYATLSSGSVTVTTNKVINTNPTSGTVGRISHNPLLSTAVYSSAGAHFVSSITSGASFNIGSTNGSDASTVKWELRI